MIHLIKVVSEHCCSSQGCSSRYNSIPRMQYYSQNATVSQNATQPHPTWLAADGGHVNVLVPVPTRRHGLTARGAAPWCGRVVRGHHWLHVYIWRADTVRDVVTRTRTKIYKQPSMESSIYLYKLYTTYHFILSRHT